MFELQRAVSPFELCTTNRHRHGIFKWRSGGKQWIGGTQFAGTLNFLQDQLNFYTNSLT